jgi:HD-GYP domain-containing protein (c-di-GMP phosphodiesterase class II)
VPLDLARDRVSIDRVVHESSVHPHLRHAFALLDAASAIGRAGALPAERLHLAHELIAVAYQGESLVLLAPAETWDHKPALLAPFAARFADGTALLVLLGVPTLRPLDEALRSLQDGGFIATILATTPSASELSLALARSFELMAARSAARRERQSVNRFQHESDELVSIARAMTTERNVDALLGLILQKCRLVTRADAGSIYVVEGAAGDKQLLRFKLTQNDSVAFDSSEFTMPLSTQSIAGSVALSQQPLRIDDVYNPPPDSPFRFDPRFDQRVGYLTRSMLTVPLTSQRSNVIGVIQLINRKRRADVRIENRQAVEDYVIPFDDRTEELLGLVAAQAGVSLENALLYAEIRMLFEGFVQASVEAIEARDPSTSGHSRRVADLTLGLSHIVASEPTGPFANVQFTTEELREIEYASLLHDFGKIGVKENVLTKAKKLYAERLELLRARFDFVLKAAEVDVLQRKLSAYARRAADNELRALDDELTQRRADLEGAFALLLVANEPSVVAEGDFARLEEIARLTFVDMRGATRQLLDPADVVALSIRRGTLTPSEYEEISSHVSHTFKFLSKIPWGAGFRQVPAIAGAHHERINGTGYPNRLVGAAIPLQSRMMAVADVFDALTAHDRPYKKAVPIERALGILDFSVKDGHLDRDLVKLFAEARVWEQPATSTIFRNPNLAEVVAAIPSSSHLHAAAVHKADDHKH